MPPVWGFLANATYAGKETHGNFTLDFWQFQAAGIVIRLGVGNSNVNIPIVLERRG